MDRGLPRLGGVRVRAGALSHILLGLSPLGGHAWAVLSVRRASLVGLTLALSATLAPLALGDTPDAPPAATHKKPVRTKHKKKHHAPTTVAPRTTSRLTLAAKADLSGEPLVDESLLPPPSSGSCPVEMASVDHRFCVDRWEASLVEIDASGERSFSPYALVDGHDVRAVSQAGVFPQGYVSGAQAAAACERSGKRLCTPMEWRKACVGPRALQYGYADAREHGRCNDSGRSPMLAVWGLAGDSDPKDWGPLKMNDERLNQLPGSLARTGEHAGCTNDYGVYDMIGNLHEWTSDPDGTFQGGYYLDTKLNGEGCAYRTTAHDFAYHDYSTGFRCCAAPSAGLPPLPAGASSSTPSRFP